MALPALHWRLLPPVFIANSSSAGELMDAIYTMGTSTVYADGSARSPGTFAAPGTASLPASVGTGSAWTWNFDATTFGTGAKTCCYAYPPTTTAINQTIIVGCTSSVTGATWLQAQSDTRSANAIYSGCAKGTGVYTTWNTLGTPFTSGNFTGFAQTGAVGLGFSQVFMLESEEAVLLIFARGGGITHMTCIGAFVDPLSTHPANAETDGRLYGYTSTGIGNGSTTTGGTTGPWMSFGGSTTDSVPFWNITTATAAHFGLFVPGAGTILVAQRFGSFTPSPTTQSRNGDIPSVPFQITTTAGTYLGQLRQMAITRECASAGQALQTTAGVKGYVYSASTVGSTDSLLLQY
jgi:hypothetical protein